MATKTTAVKKTTTTTKAPEKKVAVKKTTTAAKPAVKKTADKPVVTKVAKAPAVKATVKAAATAPVKKVIKQAAPEVLKLGVKEVTKREVPTERLSVPTTRKMLDSLHNLSDSHPTVLYAASVMRPSLALAQGHALSLLLGTTVAIYEFSCETSLPHFGSAIRNMILRLNKAANDKGYIVSSEVGLESRNGFGSRPSTLRWMARDERDAKMVVLYSNDVIVVHDLQGDLEGFSAFPEGMEIVKETHKQLAPTVKGYVHTVSMTPNGIQETASENNIDPVITDESYPFIHAKTQNGELTASSLAAAFLKSKSVVINLYGEAGSGKSTFMAKLAKQAEDRHTILVDNAVFYTDPGAASALINHIRSLAQKGKRPLVLLEEVDEYLQSKGGGNVFLQQLLSMTSGVIESDIKVATATNLKNRDKFVDPLKRSGRTFANVEFTRLTAEQARKCVQALGIKRHFEDGKTYQLADVLTETVVNIGEDKNKVGFGN